MNIFALSWSSKEAAVFQCDKHVPKMLLESVQMLCNAVPEELKQTPKALALRNGQGAYKRAHYNHPCSIWTRESRGNWVWLLNHAWSLLDEYKFRFNSTEHKCEEMLRWLDSTTDELQFNKEYVLTPFALAMPDQYKVTSDPVGSYRNFYRAEKKFAAWSKGRAAPSWWK